MRNERLRDAMAQAGVSRDRLAAVVEMDPKSVWRWTNHGTIPRQVSVKAKIAELLGVDQSDLWPPPPKSAAASSNRDVTEEVVAAWSHRADVPKASWWTVFATAEENIDLLGYAMQFLPEDHSRLDRLFLDKAAAGCRIRIALASPDSPHVAERDEEEGLGGTFRDRIRSTVDHFDPLFGVEGIDLRFHQTRMYNSLFRGDNQMFLTPHLYALKGYRAPLLHLRRTLDDGMFDGLMAHFERIWAVSTPIPSP